VRSEQIGRTAYEIPSISAKWQLPEIATLTGVEGLTCFPGFLDPRLTRLQTVEEITEVY
jgi:hypothetical protein